MKLWREQKICHNLWGSYKSCDGHNPKGGICSGQGDLNYYCLIEAIGVIQSEIPHLPWEFWESNIHISSYCQRLRNIALQPPVANPSSFHKCNPFATPDLHRPGAKWVPPPWPSPLASFHHHYPGFLQDPPRYVFLQFSTLLIFNHRWGKTRQPRRRA